MTASRAAAALCFGALLAWGAGSCKRSAPGDSPQTARTDDAPRSASAQTKALRLCFDALVSAAQVGDVAGCRATMTSTSLRLFDDLLGSVHQREHGWRRLCAAQSELRWPDDATIEITQDGSSALLRAHGAGRRAFSLPFRRETGVWKVDLAALPSADALRRQAHAARAATPHTDIDD